MIQCDRCKSPKGNHFYGEYSLCEKCFYKWRKIFDQSKLITMYGELGKDTFNKEWDRIFLSFIGEIIKEKVEFT